MEKRFIFLNYYVDGSVLQYQDFNLSYNRYDTSVYIGEIRPRVPDVVT